MTKEEAEAKGVATALLRWPGFPIERLIAFRRQLGAARAAAHADAEGFAPLVVAIEDMGAACLGKAVALDAYREPLKRCLRLDDSENEFHDLFETVRKGRNSGMHEGAWVRHVVTTGVDLAIVIEDALARYIMEQEQQKANAAEPVWRINHFMVSEPICAESWQTVGHIRRVMLRNSFSFLPAWDERVHDWRLISDHALAEWLGPPSGDRKRKEQRSLADAIEEKPGLRLTVPAAALDLQSTRAAALVATQICPALVVDPEHRKRLLGIVTAFDLL